jgi:hypothetical protein
MAPPPAFYYPAPPQRIYQPQIEYKPLDYQGSKIYRREYATPLRDMLFGRYRIYHQYGSPESSQ